MLADQLIVAFAGTPSLPGARCRGRSHLFDPRKSGEDEGTATARHRQAVGLCELCPALAACREWVSGLPAGKRPAGVVAATGPGGLRSARRTTAAADVFTADSENLSRADPEKPARDLFVGADEKVAAELSNRSGEKP